MQTSLATFSAICSDTCGTERICCSKGGCISIWAAPHGIPVAPRRRRNRVVSRRLYGRLFGGGSHARRAQFGFPTSDPGTEWLRGWCAGSRCSAASGSRCQKRVIEDGEDEHSSSHLLFSFYYCCFYTGGRRTPPTSPRPPLASRVGAVTFIYAPTVVDREKKKSTRPV